MKYIYSIVGIVLLLTCVMFAVSSHDSEVPPDKNALVVNDRAANLSDGVKRAAIAIDSGEAENALDALIALTSSA